MPWGPAIGAVGGIAASAISSGNKPSGQTTTTGSQSPWEPWGAQQSNLYRQTEDAWRGGQLSPGYFPGQSYAGPTQASTNALSGIIGNTQAGGLLGSGANAIQSTANGDYTQGGASNPFFQGAFQNIANQIQPQVNAAFAGTNRYGSGAQAHAMADALTNAGMSMGFQNYGQERQNQLNAASQTPTMAQASYMPAQMQLGAGQQQQTDQQASINDQMTRYNFEQNRPLTGLSNYQSLLGNNPGGGQSSTNSPFFMPSAGQNAIGGALGGAAIGNLISRPAQTNGGGIGSMFGFGQNSFNYGAPLAGMFGGAPFGGAGWNDGTGRYSLS